ncbi:MAG: cell envelope integrity protein TolA [Alphaproteobacteria bacterium]|nr:cell envelope integrity protein TolA [Alphaproteobacteria bacterium]
MQRKAFLFSLGLHAVVIGLMFADFHFTREYTKAPPAVLMVDLTKVKIADKTNLPQKAVVKKEQPKVEPKKEEPKPAPKVDKPKQEVKKEEPKPEPKPAPVPKDAVAVQQKKDEKKKEPAKPEPKPKPKKPEYNLKSLLASVEKVRKEAPAQQQPEEATADALDNGFEGRVDKILTISDKDFIASKLRDCWNIDGGAQDIDEIIVEVRVLVNKDGSVRDVKILNNMNLPAFKSLSESARRAVYICANKGDESPFKILSDNYADHYSDWKELHLNFNPMNANVF